MNSTDPLYITTMSSGTKRKLIGFGIMSFSIGLVGLYQWLQVGGALMLTVFLAMMALTALRIAILVFGRNPWVFYSDRVEFRGVFKSSLPRSIMVKLVDDEPPTHTAIECFDKQKNGLSRIRLHLHRIAEPKDEVLKFVQDYIDNKPEKI